MGCFRANKCTAYGKSLDRLRFSIQMRIYSEAVCILQSFDNPRGIQQSILQGWTEVCLFRSARTSFGAFDFCHIPRQFFFLHNIFLLFLLRNSSPRNESFFLLQIFSSITFPFFLLLNPKNIFLVYKTRSPSLPQTLTC